MPEVEIRPQSKKRHRRKPRRRQSSAVRRAARELKIGQRCYGCAAPVNHGDGIRTGALFYHLCARSKCRSILRHDLERAKRKIALEVKP